MSALRASSTPETARLLEVRDLAVSFQTGDGVVQAVRGVSFGVERGRTLGIVGESGSGKSVTAQTIVGLTPGATITGSALFEGRDLLTMPAESLREVRGAGIAMIFQDPLSSLHPLYRVGWQIAEMIRVHEDVSRAKARAAGDRVARARRDPAARAARRRLSAPVLGRHAAARDDRDGGGAESEGADRGRAHDGARRHRAGADHRPHAAPAGRVRHGDHPDHARPRPRRRDRGGRARDVRRPRDGARRPAHALLPPASSVHARPARLAAGQGRHRRAADPDRGPSAEPHPAARRVPVPPALPRGAARAARRTCRRCGSSHRATRRRAGCRIGTEARRESGCRREGRGAAARRERGQALQHGAARRARPSSRPSTTSASRSAAARRSASWARPAAASRRSPAA